jgi:hypothetical protein
VEILVPAYQGKERRRKQRRLGAGRRAFRDRRVQERRFDMWTAVAVEQRSNADRRRTRRRLESRRTYPNRRSASVPPGAWEIEFVSETPPTV